MDYTNIMALLCPSTRPVEVGYLWAKFEVLDRECSPVIPGCKFVYYCANQFIAAELLTNQIKPTLVRDQSYFVIYPITDTVDIGGNKSVDNTTFAVVHFGLHETHLSQAVARTRTTQLLEYFRMTQQRYISSIRINNTTFNEWADDNSVLQQYTSVVTVRAVEPFGLAPNCP